VNFIAPGSPGEFVAKGEITKMGKSIAFTSSELYQGDTLIATATATNKMIKL
jgi:acyl-coenzyme A thioesterase PaaI-like protein